MNTIQEAQRLGQAMWIDYIRRGLLNSGEFQKLIERGISGVTSNPTIFEKAIVGSTDYDKALLTLAKPYKDTTEIYEILVIEDIQTAAALNEDPKLENIQAYAEDSGEGRWAVQESIELAVPMPVIANSLQARFRSRQTQPFGAKLLAALRQQFGGHKVRRTQ